MSRVVAPYGSWRSPISAQSLVADSVRLSSVQVDGRDIYWCEGRPSERGREVLVRWRDGVVSDMVGPDDNVRTLVHEYGGRSYGVRDGVVVWSSFADQRLRRVGIDEPLTPDDGSRYADHEITPDGRWVLCVRERHQPNDVVNDVVAVALDGSGSVVVVAEGHDFFAAPRVSPDGRRVCWLSWDHPNMPWDETTLWVADVEPLTMAATGDARVLAGGAAAGVSVTEPQWSPAGDLHWASDESGWWNLYSESRGRLVDAEAEFSGPAWGFGLRNFVFLDDADQTLVASWWSGGVKHLGIVREGGKVDEIELPFTVMGSLAAVPGSSSVVGLMGSARVSSSVVRVDVEDGSHEVLRASRDRRIGDDWVSEAQSIEFPTEGDRRAYALYYAPRNPDYEAPAGELPPLIVLSHGGPTSQTTAEFSERIQFWTTRGIAVVDVNYGGSTGYGREYRERLKGQWGIVDVDDCVNAAKWLASQGLADPARLVIRGGSAGGYTTLAALTFRPDVFAAGSSLYGVADAGALARDTHKFESRYLDGLIGPYPEALELYRERSPIHHTDALSCPLILFQGLEDKVVPPEQSEMMAEALHEKGIPYAYVAFEGEQHGFRRSDSIIRVAEAELYFFGRVLGFTPADEVTPVRIEHEDALVRSG